MESIPIRLMKDRRYALIPVGSIDVLNSRTREEGLFAENVKSIKDVGLLKPILVNERFYPVTGKYELVCGEGRLIAHRELGKPGIAAEIIDCDRKTAYLVSLVENIARIPVGSMWFAREVKRMRDAGMSLEEIGRIVGRSESSVLGYVTLIERGEGRLLEGVEEGIFPIALAIRIAESQESEVQNLLMDAFDQGVITTGNLRTVRRLVNERLTQRPSPAPASDGSPPDPPPSDGKPSDYTVTQLKQDIARTVRDRASFVREAHSKEGRLISLLEGLKTLRSGEGFMSLLKAEGLAEMPDIKFLDRKVETALEVN